jgi:vacuolar protein sorting-associated protein 13A/C
VLSQIHERNRKWTWAFFEERRDDRKAYVELYKNHKLGRNDVEDEERLKALEWKLSYDDIRLYRSIAKGVLRREKILIEKKQVAEQPKGWLSSWWYGSGTDSTASKTEVWPRSATCFASHVFFLEVILTLFTYSFMC